MPEIFEKLCSEFQVFSGRVDIGNVLTRLPTKPMPPSRLLKVRDRDPDAETRCPACAQGWQSS